MVSRALCEVVELLFLAANHSPAFAVLRFRFGISFWVVGFWVRLRISGLGKLLCVASFLFFKEIYADMPFGEVLAPVDVSPLSASCRCVYVAMLCLFVCLFDCLFVRW